MSKFNSFAYYWLPAIIWMGIIFYFSSRLNTSVTGEFLFDFIFVKSLHIIEYSILYFLMFRAFYSINNSRLTINNKLLLPIFFSVFYALSDEIHQTFVPTREGKIRDVFIDTAGILIMYIYIKHNITTLKKILK